ncbi:substrate-binding domain-containing protein [Pseudomonas sp. S37]|uniref:LacI family DNA-binding transcriptional regulator n=1 Tax=Pseudomonas sp. S37 TaxID=2767449 RepID=UPI0019115F69|nr:LacI family DNA-binding transcriptional regulator [Pseudomonas sp. S37]MBK4996396.1 substrate-binding domain-containing protein [Pseudomonas sp. S37]
MTSRPRLHDVAALAGVSPATVSRALSNPQLVRADTREKIQHAIERLGYLPDGSARALASGRARTIGAIMPTLDNAIFARAVQGLQTTLANQGYQLLLATHEYNPSAELELVRALLGQAIDGLVLVGADHSPQVWEMVRSHDVRLLVTWASHPGQPSLGFDNYRIGQLAAEHLLRLGHRRMGVISGFFRHNDRARARLAGFRETLASAGCTLPDGNIVEQPFGFEGGRAGLNQLLRLSERPTAVFCGNDVLSVGCLFEAQALGLNVPADLSIVGCDNLPLTAQVTPGVTTVLLPTYELGQRAADTLLQWIRSGQPPQSECLPVELIVRGTTAPPQPG